MAGLLNPEEFKKHFLALAAELQNGAPGRGDELLKLIEDAKQRQEQMRKTVQALQESIDSLRLNIKYLIFDLEATRRENDALKKQLEEYEQGGGSSG